MTDFADFTELVDRLADGETTNEASHQLQQLVKACRDTGKSGSLVLTLTISPRYGADEPDIDIDSKVSIRPPARNLMPTKTWADRQGHILLSNPDQDQLPTITELTFRGNS